MATRTFSHPYVPYGIQLQLMEQIYKTLEGGYKVGIFESPTGTGKTLSIICSTMTWLREQRRKALVPEDGGEDEPEWVRKVYKDTICKETRDLVEEYESYLDEVSEAYKYVYEGDPGLDSDPGLDKNQKGTARRRKRQKVDIEIHEEDFLPADYTENTANQTLVEKNMELNTEIKQMIRKIQEKSESRSRLERVDKLLGADKSTVYFASRTHSQLSQFAEQLAMPQFPASVDVAKERVKYFPMGSRKQLCINRRVAQLGNSSLINDACLDLQKKESQTCCKYYQNYQKDGGETVGKFRDLVFSKIQDIEDLGKIGRSLKICPYYSSKNTYSHSEIVSLPYQLLLDADIRQLLDIDIRNSIVIIDEAHNLADTIVGLNSVAITLAELQAVQHNLGQYYRKFMKRLNSGNRINILKLARVLKSLVDFVASYDGQKVRNGLEINITDMFGKSNGDLVNIHSLETYLKQSKIAYKIENYLSKTQQQTAASSTPLLFKLVKFIKLISNPSKEGKLFFNNDPAGSLSLNYMLLNPTDVFRQLIDSCKCVLLCGGTMEPILDFTDFLFPHLDPARVLTFSCDHIIPKQNLSVIPVCNAAFDFSFANRNSQSMILLLGRCLVQIARNVPDGMVVFFPSYKYLHSVVTVWTQSPVWTLLNKTKKTFFEPRNSTDVDALLAQYSTHIHAPSRPGAVLLSVVGGKVSEGINFSNELARAVVMVGLPYPNIFSGEIINKRNYIEESTIAKGGTPQQAKEKSIQFYENLCMKAVNQSIGRAIRNSKDYAIIYLIDHRYGTPKIQSKLSKWVRDRIVLGRPQDFSLEKIVQLSKQFFSYHQNGQTV